MAVSQAAMRRRARIMRAVNVPMRAALSLPFATPLSGNLMLISYTGRKSGKAYRQPVSYVRDGDVLLTPGGGRWTLNLADGWPARIRLRGPRRARPAGTGHRSRRARAAARRDHRKEPAGGQVHPNPAPPRRASRPRRPRRRAATRLLHRALAPHGAEVTLKNPSGPLRVTRPAQAIRTSSLPPRARRCAATSRPRPHRDRRSRARRHEAG